MELSPTLWRTCRVLSGRTRLRLFRLVVKAPGLPVSELAERADVDCPVASQELRRLQSRGLIRRGTAGRNVFYRPEPDPQVPSAAPILKAMQAAFAAAPAEEDSRTAAIAAALAHPRRIAILQELRAGPRNIHALAAALHISRRTLYHHLQALRRGKMIGRGRLVFRPVPNRHPLAVGLVALLNRPENAISR